MKRKIVSLSLMVAAIAAVTLSVTSCKDSDFEYLMQQQLDENSTLDEALKAQVTALEQTLQSVQSEQGVMQGVIDALQGVVDANTKAIEENQKAIDEATKAIEDNANAIIANSEQIAQHQELIDANTKAIEDNTTAIEKNAEALVTVTEGLATAEAAIGVLDDAMQAINDALAANGFEDMNDLASQVVGVVNAYDDLKKEVEQNASDIVKMESDIADLETSILGMETEIGTLTEAVGDLAGSVGSLTDTVNGLTTTVNGLTETVGTLSGTVDKLVTDVSGLENSVTNLQGQIDTINNTLESQSQTISQLLTDVAYTKELAEANEQKIETLNESLTTLTTDLDGVKSDLANAKQDISDLKDELSSVSSQVDKIQESLDSINDSLSGLEGRLTTAEDNINTLLSDMTEVQEGLAKAQEDIKDLQQQAEEYLQEAKDYADQLIEDLRGNFTYDTLGEFQEAMEQALADYQSDLSDLTSRVETLEKEMEEVTEQINDILSRLDYVEEFLDALQSYLSKQVTSILVQATTNPIFGTFALPMNVTSNVLAAYYGSVDDSDAVFPTSRKVLYADPTEGPFLTDEDIAMLGVDAEIVGNNPDGYLLLDKEGNAGTLYVTVNPNTVDFSGLSFGMENSIQEASGVELGGLNKSDYRLSFGYTRADVSNGFYEATATVPSVSIAKEVAPRIDINALKDVINDMKDYIKSGSGLDVSGTLSTLYKQFTDVLDANAIYAEWTDDAATVHRTYSQYSLAASAVHPLSYAFMADQEYETFPGINRIENVINSLFEKIEIPTFDLSQYKLSHIDHVSYDETYIYFDAKIQVSTEGLTPGETVYIYGTGENGELVVIGEGTWDGTGSTMDIWITLELRKDEIYAEPIDDINDVIDSINNALDDINDILDDLESINKIASGLQEVQDQLISYVDRLNEQLCKMINSVNETLQPIILVHTDSGFTKISQMRSSPTLLSAGDNITLLPTSFTAEILAPAFQKLVGVTNVYSISDLDINAQNGDSTCLSLLRTANSSSNEIAKIIDGDTRQVSISGLKAGYIYEIAYTAVDYSGKVAAQKCYVRVAE